MSMEYIRNAYGVSFKRGDRIKYMHGNRNPVFGTVTRGTHHVWVRFDGDTHSTPVHPTDENMMIDLPTRRAER